MGYTQYWNLKKSDNYQQALNAVQLFVRAVDHAGEIKLANAFGEPDSKPEVLKGVRFNGMEPEDYETFHLPEQFPDEEDHFDFCKTQYRPYDDVVTGCLSIMKHYMGDGVRVSSDGEPEQWEAGIKLVKDMIGLVVMNPIGGTDESA